MYTPSRQFRSSADAWILHICRVKPKTFSQCSFSYCAPKQWNSLPSNIPHIHSSHAFKTALKTLQGINATSDFKFCLLHFVLPHLSPFSPHSLLHSFCVCAYACGLRGIQYYVYMLFLRFYVYTFVELVDCDVLTHSGEI